MQLNEFIFSNKRSHRITRHLVFWGVYCFYFWLQSFAPRKYEEFFISDTYYFAFLNLCSFGPVFIVTTYFFIYYLLPQTLRKKKYGLFIFYFLLAYLVGTLINYFTAGIFLNSVTYSIPVEPNFQHRMQFGNYNTRWGMIIATLALGIKLSKDWYLQQKENLEILKQKTRTEMQLQKARIHPELLFRTLNSINTTIQSGSASSNSMILSLSDLLSYSLYESEIEFVPLEKEIMAVRQLICLEKLNKENLAEIYMQTDGEIGNKFIAPMVMVKLIEESFNFLHNDRHSSWLMSLHITITDLNLNLALSFISQDAKSSTHLQWPLFISNTYKWLSKYYSSNDYQIELSEGKEETLIRVTFSLTKDSKKANRFSTVKFNPPVHDPA